MDTKKKVKQSLPYSIAISLLNLVISLFGMVYLVRYLEEVDFGMLGLFTGLPFLLNIAVAMGFDMYITRFLPNKIDNKEVAGAFWRIIFIRIVLLSTILVFLVVGFPYYAHLFKMQDYQAHFNVYQISLLATFGNIYVQIFLNSRFLQKQILIMRILYQAMRLAVIFWGIIGKKDFYFFVVGFAIIDAINLFFGFIMISIKIAPPRLRDLFTKVKESDEEKEYRLVSYANQIGTSFLGSDIDRYILGYFSNPGQVAIYVLTTQILGKLANFFPQKMFKPLATPAFFTEYDNSKENNEKLNRMFQFIFNANNIVGFMFLACFIPLGRDLLDFFFQKPYTQDAFWPVTVFMMFMVLYSMPIGMVTQAIKKPKILLISKVSILFNLGLGIPLAKFYGATGMAAATAASLFLKNIIIYVLVRRHVDVAIPWVSLIKSLMNSGLTIAISMWVFQYIHTHVLIDASLTAILYLGLMRANPIFTEEQKVSFFKLIPKKIFPIAKLIF